MWDEGDRGVIAESSISSRGDRLNKSIAMSDTKSLNVIGGMTMRKIFPILLIRVLVIAGVS